jgi:XTP/dITP diphosphohydrolase
MTTPRTLILATRNQGKVRELRDPLARFGFDVQSLPEDFPEIEENGTTFEENALIKARAVKLDGAISIAADSGLCVNALAGAPGIYSARYAGEPCDDKKNNAKVLKELEGSNDRSAAFVCAIACVMPDGSAFTVRGKADGIMLKEEKGEGGFGYDPRFIFPALNKTFAELSREEKHEVSHRGNALRLLREELLQRLK